MRIAHIATTISLNQIVLNVEALADGLARLCEDSALARRLAETGQRRVRQHFNEPVVAERVLLICEHILSRRRDPLPEFPLGAGA